LFDVIVAGGGPAGITAAIAAQRRGLRTLLVEKYGFLGGMATAGLVTPFMPTLGAGGLYQEFLRRLDRWGALKATNFDGELAKLVLDEWLTEEGVEILFHGLLTRVLVEAGKIKSIKISGKGQELHFQASYFIDATGDGDLASLSGITMTIGREPDHLCQPMTTCFQVGGVDDRLMPSRHEFNRLYDEAKARKIITNPRENILWFHTIRSGEIHFNTTRVVGRNPVSILELTQAELEARRQIAELFRWMRKEIPAFKNSYLMRIAAQIGVRESRMLLGEYRLTEEDVLTGRKFEDAIGKCSYPIDIHNPQGTGTRIAELADGDWYEIPYRSLYTTKIINLLVAGRCISATHQAQASLRIMPTCMVMGHP